MDRAGIATLIMNTQSSNDLGLKMQERAAELFVSDEREVQTAQHESALERIAQIRAGN